MICFNTVQAKRSYSKFEKPAQRYKKDSFQHSLNLIKMRLCYLFLSFISNKLGTESVNITNKNYRKVEKNNGSDIKFKRGQGIQKQDIKETCN